MATYLELYGLQGDGDLHNRIAVAVVVSADTIRSEAEGAANHANRLVWAGNAFADPRAMAKRAFWAVLAANKSASVSNIQSATDAAIQTNVDAVVDVLAGS